MKKLYIIGLTLLFPFLGMAQDFTITGQLKPRFEGRQGFKTLRPADENLDVPSNFVSQRSRLSFLYASKENKLRVGLSVQDVRTWGATKQLVIGDANNLGLHEAWAEILFTPEFSLKAGRQELVYDDARILGNVDWAQQGRSHDLALFKYENNFKLHAGIATNAAREGLYKSAFEVSNYKAMQFLWFNKKWEQLNLSVMLLNNGVEFSEVATPTPADLQTVYAQLYGSRLEYRNGTLAVNAAAYYQGGKNNLNQTLKAYNALGEVFLTVGKGVKVMVGTELLSGTDMDAEDGISRSFTPFYGTNHKFNGLMDYFYVGNHANSVGLADHYAGVSYKKDKFGANLRAHVFNSMGNIVTEATDYDKNLGTEIDLTAKYQLTKEVGFQAGYSVMSATESMEVLKGGDHTKLNHWGWAMIVIKPTFFTTKK
ncbi:alginate export family protein [Algivirga pacifica]|uniref:Alginate export family protein n=1 Tax=Algivirga pacifica TaxID=1162670 RepID=A0ABP9DBN2_9BACT